MKLRNKIMLKIRHNLNTTEKNPKTKQWSLTILEIIRTFITLRGMFVELWNGRVRTAFCDV